MCAQDRIGIKLAAHKIAYHVEESQRGIILETMKKRKVNGQGRGEETECNFLIALRVVNYTQNQIRYKSKSKNCSENVYMECICNRARLETTKVQFGIPKSKLSVD